jgi:ribosome-associated protein YbcJ (S4-like RNA binding protein)
LVLKDIWTPGRNKKSAERTKLNMAKKQQQKPYWHEHVVSGRQKKSDADYAVAHPMRRVPTVPKTAGKTTQVSSALVNPPAKPKAGPAPLDGSGQPYITLVQFLKMHQLVDTGGMGKQLIRDGGILVNDSEELRPGRKLHQGDSVTAKGKKYSVKVNN